MCAEAESCSIPAGPTIDSLPADGAVKLSFAYGTGSTSILLALHSFNVVGHA